MDMKVTYRVVMMPEGAGGFPNYKENETSGDHHYYM